MAVMVAVSLGVSKAFLREKRVGSNQIFRESDLKPGIDPTNVPASTTNKKDRKQ